MVHGNKLIHWKVLESRITEKFPSYTFPLYYPCWLKFLAKSITVFHRIYEQLSVVFLVHNTEHRSINRILIEFQWWPRNEAKGLFTNRFFANTVVEGKLKKYQTSQSKLCKQILYKCNSRFVKFIFWVWQIVNLCNDESVGECISFMCCIISLFPRELNSSVHKIGTKFMPIIRV